MLHRNISVTPTAKALVAPRVPFLLSRNTLLKGFAMRAGLA